MAVEVLISSKSGSVSGGDWTPALAAAHDDIKSTGGSIILDAETEFKTAHTFVFGTHVSNINLVGRGAKAVINANSGVHIWNFGNLGLVRITDIPFIGETGTSATADCNHLIKAGYVDRLIVDNCLFAGIIPNGALVYGETAANIVVTNSKFGGCGGAHVKVDGANSLKVDGCDFFDYQNYLSAYYDRSVGAARIWVDAINAPTLDNASRGCIDIQRCGFDEGAPTAVRVEDYGRVNLERTGINHGVATAGAMQFTNCEHVYIKQHWAGYNSGLYPSMVLDTCGDVVVDGLQIHNGVKEIEMDATTRLKVLNSPDATVVGVTGSRYELNGVKYAITASGTVVQVG